MLTRNFLAIPGRLSLKSGQSKNASLTASQPGELTTITTRTPTTTIVLTSGDRDAAGTLLAHGAAEDLRAAVSERAVRLEQVVGVRRDAHDGVPPPAYPLMTGALPLFASHSWKMASSVPSSLVASIAWLMQATRGLPCSKVTPNCSVSPRGETARR